MCCNASVGVVKLCGCVGVLGNKAYSRCINVDIRTYKTLIVIILAVDGYPVAVIVKSLNSERLYHAGREAEGGSVIRARLEKRHRNSDEVGVALNKLTIKIAIENGTEGGNVRFLRKCVRNRSFSLAVIAVIASPYTSVKTVYKCGAITVAARKGCISRKLGL